MKVRPRQQLLEIWRSLLAESIVEDKWVWADPKGRNSIADAQQLLCLMLPSVEIASLRFSDPNGTYDDVLHALQPLGGAVEIPRKVLQTLIEYHERHRDEGGPTFQGGGYLLSSGDTELSDDERKLDIVEGFALSITLALSSLTFAREFRQAVSRPETRQSIDHLEEMARQRLTAALVGLIRSFTVDVFETNSEDGQNLLGMMNQAHESPSVLVKSLQYQLREVTAALPTLRLAVGDLSDLDNWNRLYQVGWSWGVVHDKPKLDFVSDSIPQRDGVAFSGVYLYFTVVAMDGLADLFSSSTRLLGLLNDEQHRLAQALRERWELTQRYWSTLASFGTGQWPLEDLPWMAIDGIQHDYFSLLVSSITIRDLDSRKASGAEFDRLAAVLLELGNRARITRRPLDRDPAVSWHTEGVRLGLDLPSESETGIKELFGWAATDFAALLMKRTVRVLDLAVRPEVRRQAMTFLDHIWDHMQRRKLGARPENSLWDQPANIFGGEERKEPLWQPTLRVVEALVLAAETVTSSPASNREVGQYVHAMMSEAEHLYDQEVMRVGTRAAPAIQHMLSSVHSRLDRIRSIMDERPATAGALLQRVLEDLDGLSAAREMGT